MFKMFLMYQYHKYYLNLKQIDYNLYFLKFNYTLGLLLLI